MTPAHEEFLRTKWNAIVATITSSRPSRKAVCTLSRWAVAMPAWYAAAFSGFSSAASASACLRVGA